MFRRVYCSIIFLTSWFSVIAFSQVGFIDQAFLLGITHGEDSRGVAIVDLESDGISEIIVINKHGYNRLYKWNSVTSEYDELAEEYGIAETIEHHNITIADVDKNLNPDLYITSHPALPDARYYLNLGGPPFVDVAEAYNLDSLFEMGSAFFQIAPQTGVSGLLGGRLMIREDNVFVDYTEHSGLETISNQLCPIFFDIDGDFIGDLFIAGNHETNTGRLFRNNGDTTFTDISTNSNEAGFPYGQGVSVGDIDNDGDFDFYLASGFGTNTLWQNDGHGYFTNITNWSNTGYGGYSRGTNFGDFDNDCDLDLFLNRGTDSNVLLLNNGSGQFTDVSQDVGIVEAYNGMGSAIGDLNNDGQLDIVATNCNRLPTCVYINQNHNNSWLKVKLIGRRVNSLALGAIIKLWGMKSEPYDSNLIGMRRIAGLTSFLSVDDLIVHFGTDDYEYLTLEVTFASLERVIIRNIVPGRTITVVEPRTSVDEGDILLPAYYLTLEAYPNPFNSATLFTVNNGSGECHLVIFDILGRKIKTAQLSQDIGINKTFTWDGTDDSGTSVPSGVYLVKAYNGQIEAEIKVTMVK